jgi:glycosyltransferase involved in cell wall biosynthesis
MSQANTPTISLIATVLNEADNIDQLLRTMQGQTQPPDEIVIVDGGSTDGTQDVIQRYADEEGLPINLVIAEDANISEGRNIAFRHATGDIVAITDAGVRLESDWLALITRPLIESKAHNVSCGFFQADPKTLFEVAMGATVLPLADEIDPATFLPSSRSVAVRRDAIMRVGGYPEWLDYCEDLIFDLRLKMLAEQQGQTFAFVPQAVAHFRPRPTLSDYFKQYYRYARGDGKADLWRKRHAIRYITYLVVVPVVALLGLLVHPLLWGLYVLGGAIYLRQPYRRLPFVMGIYAQTHATSIGAWLGAGLLIPVIRVWGDVAKMLGYPVGLRWRKAQNPPDWQIL